MARASEVRNVPDVSSVPDNVGKVLIHNAPDERVSMDVDAHSALVNIEGDSSINDSNIVVSVDVSGNNAIQNVRFFDFDFGEYINFDDSANEIGPINIEEFETFFFSFFCHFLYFSINFCPYK